MSQGASRQRNVVLEAVEAFRDMDASVLLNSVVAFLYAAENEGVGVKELSYLCRLNEATTSRAIRALAAADAPGALPPSLGLVVLVQNPRDARGRLIFLTNEGQALCRRIDTAINGAVAIKAVTASDADSAAI